MRLWSSVSAVLQFFTISNPWFIRLRKTLNHIKALRAELCPPTLSDGAWTLRLSSSRSVSLLGKYFWAHVLTGGTHSSVTHVTSAFFVLVFLWIRFSFWLLFSFCITTLIPICYWVNPMETQFVVFVVFWRCLLPTGLNWTLLLVWDRKSVV